MKVYKEIEQSFENLANNENSIQMSKYMRNKFDFYGIKTPQRKEVYKDYLKFEGKNKDIDWELIKLSWDNPYREFQYFACDYLEKKKKYLTFDHIGDHLLYLAKTKQWWDTIDRLDRIIGFIGLSDSRVDDLMLAWSKDPDIWLRRIAIDHQIGRKDLTKEDLLEKIIVNNFYSEEFFINKSIGWSLREYSKTNPDYVVDFVKKYEDQMSNLSKKEALKRVERTKDARR